MPSHNKHVDNKSALANDGREGICRRHCLGINLEAREGDEAAKPPTIVGRAAVFYDGTPGTEFKLWKGAVERIAPSAFDAALTRPDDVRALFNHDANLVLGRTSAGTLGLSKDKRGLSYRVDTPDTPTGKEVTELIRRRDVKGSSFAFWVEKEERAEEGDLEIFTILSVRLADVSPVTFPAYEATTAEARASCDARRARLAAPQRGRSRSRVADALGKCALAT